MKISKELKNKSGRPKEGEKHRITVPKARAEFLEMLANFSTNTFDKVKKFILEALK